MNGAGGDRHNSAHNTIQLKLVSIQIVEKERVFCLMDPESDRAKIGTSEVSSKMTPGKYVPLVFPKY